MITTSNLLQVLKHIGFKKANVSEYYTKDYGTCIMAVDFDNKKLIYPEVKGLIVNDKTTSNFEHPENFVVFECVCRLLEKGYRPEHIELERRWQLGRDGKSGKADILVTDERGTSLIIIECKTSGKEYNKEIKNTEEYGGQLFSYWQQEPATRWLALYASDWKDERLIYFSPVINCTDDANIVLMAKKDDDVKLYQRARNEVDKYETWDETYNHQWLDNLIFDEESQAYNIGIPPLRKGKLRDFTHDDKIVNKFEEILRHNNVSDKENAFNRLVALFICKLVDEIQKQDFEEVEFQYKPGVDTYETLQDRLQRLHTQGMNDFMKEKIFYVEADYAERLFMQYTGQNRKKAIADLNNTIRILKFYSNNDFTFKDVHNEELFYQNGKILVEVVQLFQPYRIVYPSKHQFLGDLFEQLLNKGFKQNEGQFFTPMPITRFIWDSLPISDYINRKGLPRVIDYACGAGHFLTEAVEAINGVREDADNSWVEKHIYGVEKDYRLARVSKISMFMNGAGGANIIFGDGLENYPEKEIDNGSFDILVANPPYSVSGFKQHLKLKNNSFELLPRITTDSSDIETLFVERIVQVLKPQGIAAVVLPSSILSNNSASYTGAREQLLQHFMLHAIVSFGSKTFGATGTNTIVLFLEKYNEPPKVAELAQDAVNAIMQGLDDHDWEDKELLEAYCRMQQVEVSRYKDIIARTLSADDLSADSYFKMYTNIFNTLPDVKYPKNFSAEQCKAARTEHLFDFVESIERSKLYYFALTCKQATTVVTGPTDVKEQKSFLGYDWSNRKGAEGIVIHIPGGMLYNDEDRFARGTLACAIRNAFFNSTTTLPDDVAKYVKTHHLYDLMDFGRVEFDKTIKLSSTKGNIINYRFPTQRLGNLLVNVVGASTKIAQDEIKQSGKYPVVTQQTDNFIAGYSDNVNVITDLPLVLFGDHTCAIKYIDFPFLRGADGTQLIKVDGKQCMPKYLYYFLSYIEITNKDRYERHYKYLKEIEVSLPPLSIQQQIVEECQKVDDTIVTSQNNVEKIKLDIHKLVDDAYGEHLPLSAVASFSTDRKGYSSISPETFVTTENLLQNCEGVKPYDGDPNIDSVIEYQVGDLLLSNIRPYLKKLWLSDRDGGCNPDVLVLRVNKVRILPKYFYYQLARQKFFDFVMADVKGVKMPRGKKEVIMRYPISVPPLSEQQRIVKELIQLEHEIDTLQQTIADCPGMKQAILDKYLK